MKTLQLTLIVLALIAVDAKGDSLTLEKSVEGLDPFIQSVSLCGHWEHGQEQGRYRVVYGWLWGHTEIYVQWLADPIWYPRKGQNERRVPLVMKTVSFVEFNHYESATDLDNVKCQQSGQQWVITVDSENSHEEPPLKSVVTIYLENEPGKYRLARNTGLSK